VIWEFAGTAIPKPLVDDLERLVSGGLPKDLAALLASDEQKALLARARRVLAARKFPADSTGRRYPWPLV
jgi:hypothetical protein